MRQLKHEIQKDSPPKSSFNYNSSAKQDEEDYAEEVFEEIEESNEDPFKTSKDKKVMD